MPTITEYSGPNIYNTPQANLPRATYDYPPVIAKKPEDEKRKKLFSGYYGAYHIVKDGEGILFFAVSRNKNASSRYLMIFDVSASKNSLSSSASIKAYLEGAAVKYTFISISTLQAGLEGGIDAGYYGIPFANGCIIAFSTSETELALTTTQDGTLTALYE